MPLSTRKVVLLSYETRVKNSNMFMCVSQGAMFRGRPFGFESYTVGDATTDTSKHIYRKESRKTR